LALQRDAKDRIVRTFIWWFGMGSLTTLSVLMVQGGLHNLIYNISPTGGTTAFSTFATTILGGGLLAGSLALIMNRLR
jgi:hypothetical protein